jgi:hypothetical protein
MYDVLTTIAASSGFFMFVRCVVVSDASEGLSSKSCWMLRSLSLLRTYQFVFPYRTTVPKTLWWWSMHVKGVKVMLSAQIRLEFEDGSFP